MVDNGYFVRKRNTVGGILPCTRALTLYIWGMAGKSGRAECYEILHSCYTWEQSVDADAAGC